MFLLFLLTASSSALEVRAPFLQLRFYRCNFSQHTNSPGKIPGKCLIFFILPPDSQHSIFKMVKKLFWAQVHKLNKSNFVLLSQIPWGWLSIEEKRKEIPAVEDRDAG